MKGFKRITSKKTSLNNLYQNPVFINAVKNNKSKSNSVNENLETFYLTSVKIICFWSLVQILVKQI